MSNLTIYDGLFREGAPDREEYFTALLTESVRCGLLSPAEEMHLKRQVMDVLAERIRLFTKGESTAVLEETADMLLTSVLYCISIALLSAGGHRQALTLLREQSIATLHERGMAHLLKLRVRAELLSLLLLRTQFPGMSGGYNRFVGRDAYRYVKKYDALYNAAAEQYVRIDELGLRETCRGLVRLTEIMEEILRYHRASS